MIKPGDDIIYIGEDNGYLTKGKQYKALTNTMNFTHILVEDDRGFDGLSQYLPQFFIKVEDYNKQKSETVSIMDQVAKLELRIKRLEDLLNKKEDEAWTQRVENSEHD